MNNSMYNRFPNISISRIEEIGMNQMGYNVVNVAQKLDINISSKGNVSVSALTDVFPSATLSLNGISIMKYNQPSFKATHSLPIIGQSNPMPGMILLRPTSSPIYDTKYKPATWHKRL
jgi:hypothetical protein